MIYWFKRQSDDYIFPLEERAASQQFYQATTDTGHKVFTYLGRSSGKLFAEEAKKIKRTRVNVEKRTEDLILTEGASRIDPHQEQKDQYQFAYELELEECLQNKDFTPPVDVRKMDKITDPRGQAVTQQMLGQ